MRPSTVLELAEANGVEPPPGLTDDGYGPYEDFADFIARYIRTCACIRTADDLHRIARELSEDAAAEGVRYAEVTFTPLGHAIDGDWHTPVAAVLDGFAEGEERFGTRCNLVLDCVRGWEGEEAERTLEAALVHRDRGVVALGLGGYEGRPGAPFADLFGRAVAEGLHSVPHAGEAEGPHSIREALELLRAERLGHGFRVLEDPDLTDEVRERRIPLEVCPSSNVATRLVASITEHPLPRLLEAGLVVTLNSDDPAMFRSPICGEYEAARTVFGLSDTDLAALARAGVEASFADEATKRRITDEIDGWLKEDPGPGTLSTPSA